MKIRRIISLFMAILLCGTWGGALQPSMAAELPKTDGYVFKLSEAAPMMLSAENSLSGIAPVAYADGYFTADTLAELQPLIDAGLVEYAVPNAKLTLFAEPATNDPGLAQQWYADSLGISSAWNQGLKGTGVKVALVDSGIYKTHEDLQGATIDGTNFLGGGNFPDNWGDTLGHGTLVAGLLAAKANNGKGVAGLTDHASILALRCFAPKESGSMDSGSGDVSVIMEALGYAISQNVDVINMSFGGSDAELLKPIEEQLQKAADKGILLVAAAGNDGNPALQYPAAFNCVTGVGNVNSAGTVASTSQRNSSVFVTAPGTNIYGLGYNADAPYRADSGTSFSSPIVASLATIAKQADKGINNDGFRALLKECATDKGETGYDTSYGNGIVSAQKLVEALQKPRNITYEPNGGTAVAELPPSYTILRTEPVAIPDATKADCTFSGWYEKSDCTGTPITQIPSGSVGDLTLYAGWKQNAVIDTAVTSVTVSGVAATAPTDSSFTAVLPYETVLANIQATDIIIVPHDAEATVVAPTTADSGATWSFSVAGKEYTLKLTVASASAPVIAEGQKTQTGNATPASHDGKVAAVPYSASMESWSLEQNLTWNVAVSQGAGVANIDENKTLTYSPALTDANKTVILQGYATNAQGIQSEPVTVTIEIGATPISNSVVTPNVASYDVYNQNSGIKVALKLYGNTVTSLKSGEKTLVADSDYVFSKEPTVEGNESICTINHSYLSKLSIGVHELTFAFNNGNSAVLTLTVSDSTPPPPPPPPPPSGGVITPPPPPKPDLVLFNDSNIKLTYTMDKSGTAQVTVDLKELEALAKEGLPAKFDFSTVEDATGLAISGENLQAVEKTGVELVLPSAEIKLDASALAGVLNQAGKDVQISATQVENSKLTEAQKKLVGDAPTFDFTITSEGKTISDFKGGTATVSVPYTLGKDENPEFITIWLLDDAGKLTPIVAEYAEGKVTFTTGHFSRYAIGYLPFTDVADDWAYEAVVFAYNNQLFSGVGSDKFAPAANMTRGMLWSVLYRMAGSPGKTDDPLWYADAKKWAITETISDGSNPTDYVTREQLTTILYRFAKGQVQKADMSVFADTAQISPFAKDGVSWAVASKILQGDHGSLDPQGNATRAQVAAILQRFAEKV